MTAQQMAEKLRKQQAVLRMNVPLQIAAQSVHAMRVERIFDKGIDGASYSTKGPIYVDNTQLRRKNKGKSGKAEKTSYFENYGALKAAQGFDPNIVNLRLTNDLQSDFANSAKTNGTGKPPAGKVIKVNNGLFIDVIRRDNNVKKWRANIKRFGNFGAFTDEERKEFYRVYEQEMKRLLL